MGCCLISGTAPENRTKKPATSHGDGASDGLPASGRFRFARAAHPLHISFRMNPFFTPARPARLFLTALLLCATVFTAIANTAVVPAPRMSAGAEPKPL